MEKSMKTQTPRWNFVGKTNIYGSYYDVFIDKGHFALASAGKFVQHIKASTLRIAGIFSDNKKIFGRHGYVGCPKR